MKPLASHLQPFATWTTRWALSVMPLAFRYLQQPGAKDHDPAAVVEIFTRSSGRSVRELAKG